MKLRYYPRRQKLKIIQFVGNGTVMNHDHDRIKNYFEKEWDMLDNWVVIARSVCRECLVGLKSRFF